MKRPLLVRALTIAAVAAALLVPIALIEGKISERRARADAVVAQFAAETFAQQVIAGPLLALTCEETYVEEREVKRAGKAETVSERKTMACPTVYFPPRTLNVGASMPVESRHRGIYPLRLYRAPVSLSGEFSWPAPPAPNGDNVRTWKKASVITWVSDPRGIKSANFAMNQDLGDYASRKKDDILAFDYRMEIAGTSGLFIAPVGDATVIRLSSTWPHPSFAGGWSPDERQVGADGFQAAWRTTHLATGGQPFWDKAAHDGSLRTMARAAGVTLFEPINVYSLSYRATEYGFLFILFTFGALALMEALTPVRLHPIQYGLVGSAIAVFFLLLIGLSEHIHFGIAYAAAASACVLLLAVYLRHPLGSLVRTAAFTLLFAALYGALYVLLKSEDHALLLGSLMVFTMLAGAMIATRKLDWSARYAPTGG
jgi:inner membrane protein